MTVKRMRFLQELLRFVGLGGRLDAANMVDADVAVITSIDLDHQEWLGDTRGAIAQEKAGIMRPERACYVPWSPVGAWVENHDTDIGPVFPSGGCLQ